MITYSMYDEIMEIMENRQYIQAMNSTLNPTILSQIPEFSECEEFEKQLKTAGRLTFHSLFDEPLGFYLIKQFMIDDYSIEKANFLEDVATYRKMSDFGVRQRIGAAVFRQYCTDDDIAKELLHHSCTSDVGNPEDSMLERASIFTDFVLNKLDRRSLSVHEEDDREKVFVARQTFIYSDSNPIGVYGSILKTLQINIQTESYGLGLFDDAYNFVLDDLRLDVFRRFLKSKQYDVYIRIKSIENFTPCVQDFTLLRCLGKGAFGYVNACVKTDTQAMYAVKILFKCQFTTLKNVISSIVERDLLAEMNSPFVVCLKYAMTDEKRLYYVEDLCGGGDLKYHICNEGHFSKERVEYYTAQVLLGLEHIHSKNIIYRDIKLENILFDSKGNCRISDLGLSVKLQKGESVRGYAGTPGYTAPEVIKHQLYDDRADFFSLGVLIYRMMCGKKPFTPPKKRSNQKARNKKSKINATDLAVLNLDPTFNRKYFDEVTIDLLKKLLEKNPEKRFGSKNMEAVKQHPFFEEINFGLLELGYLNPPFIPTNTMPNVDTLRNLSHLNTNHLNQTIMEDDAFKYDQLLINFPYYSSETWQKEIVELLSSFTNLQREIIYGRTLIEESSCCSLL